MKFLIFSVTFFALKTVAIHASEFERECINFDFKSRISHKGAMFGILKNELKIQKNRCVLSIIHNKYKLKFFAKRWNIDVCRGPVHIKKDVGSIEVLKRLGDCQAPLKPEQKEFCGQYSSIVDNIENDGLIFAKGEKEDLKSDHGKIFCAYTLVKKYLGEGIVLSRNTSKDQSIFSGPQGSPVEKKNLDFDHAIEKEEKTEKEQSGAKISSTLPSL